MCKISLMKCEKSKSAQSYLVLLAFIMQYCSKPTLPCTITHHFKNYAKSHTPIHLAHPTSISPTPLLPPIHILHLIHTPTLIYILHTIYTSRPYLLSPIHAAYFPLHPYPALTPLISNPMPYPPSRITETSSHCCTVNDKYQLLK